MKRAAFALSATLLAALPAASATPVPQVTVVSTGPASVLGLVEIEVVAGQSFADPFDRAQVAVDADVFWSGGKAQVEGFWFQAFEAHQDGATEVLAPVGDPAFRVRFRPTAEGAHHVTVRLTDPDGTATADPIDLDVGPAATGTIGFVRRAADDPSALARDPGGRWVPFGLNVDWVGAGGTQEFQRYFDRMRDHGLDWTRVWMTHFDATALEWKAGEDGGAYCGLGCYDLAAAWRVDRVLALAEERGIALQLVLQQHSQFECSQWSSWADSPWNAANGGPLAHSAEFFTDPATIALSDRKVHYLAARYAHSPALLAWEIFNEVELITGYDGTAATPWMRARADLLHSLDPYGHLVTTSYAMPGMEGSPQDWGWKGYGLSQVHDYLPLYLQVFQASADWLRTFGKPAIAGEFGMDVTGKTDALDKVGAHLHNGAVGAVMAGFAGGAMTWWWDSYVDPDNLWDAIGKPAGALKALGIADWTGRLAVDVAGGDGQVDGQAASLKDGASLVWLHDRNSDYDQPDWQPVDRADVDATLPGPCASASALFFDSWTGESVGERNATVLADGRVRVRAPAFRRDVLARVQCVAPAEPGPEPVPEAATETAPDPATEAAAEASASEPAPAEIAPETAAEEVVVAPVSRRGGGCSARL